MICREIASREKCELNTSADKKVLLSGIQPSGNLMIGNYIGAIKNWASLQEEYDCLFVLVDLHAITVRQEPAELLRRCYEFIALYIACGLDPEKNTIFVQSHVPAHAELAWILNCYTQIGELNRMTQFKDKSKKYEGNVNVGLYDYPVLMAADILLYGADLVPVGEDQKQHLELTRDIAIRFNNLHGEVLTVPQPYIPKVGARIMSLQDPTAKMSKSDANANNYVALLDPPNLIRKKIKRAVTDSGREVRYDEARPGISNLISIHSCITGRSFSEIESDYEGKGYGDFKGDLAEIVADFLKPIQERYAEILADEERLAALLREGAERARNRSRVILEKVHRAIGFIPR
jgi:tryptophanyl-tRNA synthetase